MGSVTALPERHGPEQLLYTSHLAKCQLGDLQDVTLNSQFLFIVVPACARLVESFCVHAKKKRYLELNSMDVHIFPSWCRISTMYPLQYSCLENPVDGGAWWAAVHGVTKSRTILSDFTFTFHFHALEKEMATHCSVLAWRIPGTGEPGGLPSMGSHRVGHD